MTSQGPHKYFMPSALTRAEGPLPPNEVNRFHAGTFRLGAARSPGVLRRVAAGGPRRPGSGRRTRSLAGCPAPPPAEAVAQDQTLPGSSTAHPAACR